jgi:hypothetical protein
MAYSINPNLPKARATALRQGLAAQALLEAQATFGFQFSMVQADNGPEYSRYFEQ